MVARKLLGGLALAAALALSPAMADDTPFKAHEFTLANGMQVVVIPDHRAPVVTHQVWFKTGSADDPRDVGGIAHFFEHLMFRGTPKHPDGEFDEIVKMNGGVNNANTYFDRTVYYERVAKDRLPMMMELDADRMANLIIDDKVVTSERQVILEERNSRTDNEPSALFWEQMSAALFQASTYGSPVIGWRREIEGLTTEEARTFYNANYGPNNAILVVAGDVTVDEVKKLAEQYYGVLPARTLIPRIRPLEPPPRAARRVAMKDPKVGVPNFMRLYLAPSYTSDKNDEAYALEVLAYILSGAGDSSRLGLAIVKRDGIATSVGAFYDGGGIDDRMFGLYGSPAAGKTLADVEGALDTELAKFLAEGPTADELSRAKTVLVANAIYARDDQESMANYYGEGLTYGQSIAELEAWPDKIQAVTAEQVKAVANAYLRPERSVSGTLEPGEAPAATPAGGQP
ncbi:putative zinc protease [Alphaproteobacteria bacterium SO-S41]|nr:putative zinc protease [Alphaproteobacteria bacterium SO-S41]